MHYKTNLVLIVDDGVNEVMEKMRLCSSERCLCITIEGVEDPSVKVKSKRAHMN